MINLAFAISKTDMHLTRQVVFHMPRKPAKCT